MPLAEPVFGRGVPRLPGLAPDGARRHLDQRHIGTHALGQGSGRVIGPLRRQCLAELGGPSGPGGRQPGTVEQQLAGEQRAVDRAQVQDLRRSHQ